MDYIWNVTGRCNLQCTYCWDIFKKEKEIDTVKAKSLIDHIAGPDCSMILFTGGEPFVREDIFELMNYCNSKKVRFIKVCSNGTLIKKRINEIKKSPLSEIHISLDSYAEKDDVYRLHNKEVIENIELLIETVDKSKVKIVLVSVIEHNNIDKFESVLNYARRKGIYASYQFPVIDRDKSENLSLSGFSKKDYEDLFHKLNHIHIRYKKELDYFSNNYYITAKKYYINNVLPDCCMAGKEFKIISPGGEYYSCYSCKNNTDDITKCFNDKCLVWFRSGKRVHNILKLLQKE